MDAEDHESNAEKSKNMDWILNSIKVLHNEPFIKCNGDIT